MRIPYESLKPETLRAVLEEFATREGTEYGESDVSLEEKVATLMIQLKSGHGVIVYDATSDTCTLTSADTSETLRGTPKPWVAGFAGACQIRLDVVAHRVVQHRALADA